MIRNFFRSFRIESFYFVAAMIALIIWFYAQYVRDGAANIVWFRVWFGFASVLMFTMTIETYEIARKNKTFRDVEFWQSAFTKGYAIAYIMILIM